MTGTVSHISSRAVQVIIGVDTHKDQHVAVAIDGRGVQLGEKYVPVATCGYEELERWSRNLGQVHTFGVEGTGSYGAGLARFLTCRGYTVIEVNRPDRSVRYRKGKSDPSDAEMAARSVLAGVADAIPKSGEGEVEMIRMLKSAKNSAVKARTQAVNQMKALVVTAPAELREKLDGLGANALAARCRSFRPGHLDTPTAAAKYTLRSLACRYHQLTNEIQDLRAELQRLIQTTAPALVEALWRGTRHGRGSAGRRRQQPRSSQLGSRLRSAVRSESCTSIIRQDQQAPAQPWRRPPGQCGAISYSRRQAAPRPEDTGVPEPTNRGRNEQD